MADSLAAKYRAGIPGLRRSQPEPLGWVVARTDRQGHTTLTGAGVYELREDARHTLARCRELGITGWSYTICQVVPVPP